MTAAIDQFTKSLGGLEEKIDRRVGKIESVMEGLLKMAKAPAAAAGKTPEQWLTEMTKDLGHDGAISLMPGYAQRIHRDRSINKRLGEQVALGGKALGFNTYLQAIHDHVEHKSDVARNYLDKLGVKAVVAEKDDIVRKTAMSEVTGPAGGYTVPPEMSKNLMMLVIEEALVLARAFKVNMTTRTFTQPSLDQTTVYSGNGANGQSNLIGGVAVGWGAENQLLPSTFANFRQTTLTAWTLFAYAVASNILLNDEAVGLDALLTQLYGAAIAWGIDFALLRGNGVGRPLGMLNAKAAIQVTRNTGNAIKWQDIENMVAKLWWPTRKDPGLAWYCHQSCVPQINQLADGAGRPLFLNAMGKGIQEPIPTSEGVQSIGELKGIPVLVTEKLPVLGTTGDLCLFDASKYLVGQRQELEIAVSTHVFFLNYQMVWRMIARLDGQPWINDKITLADGSYQVSPFVVLN